MKEEEEGVRWEWWREVDGGEGKEEDDDGTGAGTRTRTKTDMVRTVAVGVVAVAEAMIDGGRKTTTGNERWKDCFCF